MLIVRSRNDYRQQQLEEKQVKKKINLEHMALVIRMCEQVIETL